MTIAAGGALEAPLASFLDVAQLCKILHPLLAYRNTARHQFAPDARPAVATKCLAAQDLDVLQQRLVTR